MSDSNFDERDNVYDEAREAVDHARERADHRARTADNADLPPMSADEVKGQLREIYNRNPYAVLAAAAGAGYVMGGGLQSSFTKRLARMGLKAAVLPMALGKIQDMFHAINMEMPDDD